MQLQKIAHILGVDVKENLNITGFSVDTRLTKAGNLFFALKGAKVDGHSFLEEAKKMGAIAAVVSNHYSEHVEGLQLLKVDNVLAALQNLAKWVIDQSQAKIVAITGSIGKTTTKDFIATILSEKFRVASFIGNQNSQIGLPLALLNNDLTEKDILVLEMGMDQPGQITQLTQIAPPDIAVITTTALVHVKNFGSLESIGMAKGEIFSHQKTKLGILNKDIVNFNTLKGIGTCPKISFSVTSPNTDFFLHETPNGFEIKDSSGFVSFDPLPVPGRHNLHNFLAAVSVARTLGLTWNEVKSGAAKLRLPEKRMQILNLRGATFVNDSYNACEASMKAALVSLPEPKLGGKKIACLGEMVDLGDFSEKCHIEVGKSALENIDLMLCLGRGCIPIVECWNNVNKPAFLFNDRLELVEKLREVLKEGDSVLLKGSNFKQMWKVIEEL